MEADLRKSAKFTIKELVMMLPDGIECMVDTMIQKGLLTVVQKEIKMNVLYKEFIQLFGTFHDWNQKL